MGIIKNSNIGYVNPKNNQKIGYYRTKGAAGKRYMEDRYVDILKKTI